MDAVDKKIFIKQLMRLLHVSICTYNVQNKRKMNFAAEDGSTLLSKEAEELIFEYFRIEKKNYPVIYNFDAELMTVAIWEETSPDEWILIGPVMTGCITEERYHRACKKYRKFEEAGLPIQICGLEELVSGIILLFWMITGKEISSTELWERNEEYVHRMEEILPQMSRDIFERQENYGSHNPYEQELRELDSIKNGDIDALNESISEIYEGKIGILAKEPLRHHKNVAIGNITLASRAAIEGGVGVEQSFSMADSFIQQVETLKTVSEVEMFKIEAKRAYAQTVKTERSGESEGTRNPLISGVKDYVFSHLHSAIYIADIAEHLHVNADYLSHLFHEQEHITIKQYILREKIKRSQNLLRYSDYRVQEIGFYLGFSSQSHFTKTFREIVGMTPSEYRKRFNYGEKWSAI